MLSQVSSVRERPTDLISCPKQLVERTDALVAVHDRGRTDVVITTLREHLAVTDDRRVQTVAGAYYDERIWSDGVTHL